MTDDATVPAGLVPEPAYFECIEVWEHWLDKVQSWPDGYSLKAYCIWNAKRVIEQKKQHIRAKRHGVEWLH